MELTDIIQLELPAVEHLTPEHAHDEDVEQALSKCRMSVGDIYYEMDLRTQGRTTPLSDAEAEQLVLDILYDKYKYELSMASAHRVKAY